MVLSEKQRDLPQFTFLNSEHDDTALDFRLNRSTLFSGKPILVCDGVQR